MREIDNRALDFPMYGRRNFVFSLVFRGPMRKPGVGALLAFAIMTYFVAASWAFGALSPSMKQLTRDGTIDPIFALLNYSDISYMLGDKFTCYFLGVIAPISGWMWLRHVLVVHPRAILSLGAVNKADPVLYAKSADQRINSIWTEIVGICGGAIAALVHWLVLIRGNEWYLASPIFLTLPMYLVILGGWYIVCSFIAKGLVLIVGRHFDVPEKPPFYWYFVDDPFGLRDFAQDVVSVIYFIVAGGTALLLFEVYHVETGAPMGIVVALYFLFFPVFIWRYIAIVSRLARHKQHILHEYRRELVAKFGEMPFDKGRATKEDMDKHFTAYERMADCKLIPLPTRRAYLLATVYGVQLVWRFGTELSSGGHAITNWVRDIIR